MIQIGTVTIQEYTTKYPITMIGYEAGVCWGADTSDPEKNYRRGIECLQNQHGRTYEFPDVYLTIENYSASQLNGQELYEAFLKRAEERA